MASAEGKLPVLKADGSLLPLEITVKFKIDPSTQEISITKV